MKIPMLLRPARAAQRSEARDWLGEGLRWQPVLALRLFGTDRIAAPGHAAGRGSGSSVITCNILYQISCKPIDSIVMDITFRLDSAARFPDLTG
jgi:hypothetical protein